MTYPPIVRDLRTTARAVYDEEWRLLPGAGAAIVGFPVWVAATGIVVAAIASLAGLSLAPDPWTNRTTAIAAVLAAVWLVAPAAIASYLLRDRALLDDEAALRTCYRLHHPLVLLLPPIVVLGVGAGLRAISSLLGEVVLVVGACYLAYRIAVFGHRVFALSLPRVATGVLALTLAGLGLAGLAAGALALGRDQLVADASAGVAGALGSPALSTFGSGVVVVADWEVSFVAATVLAPAIVVGGGYVLLQMGVSAVQRLRQPNVKRSSLRTGQRYPRYATPATGVTPTPSPAGGGSSNHGQGGAGGALGEHVPEDASRHTRAAQAETAPATPLEAEDDEEEEAEDDEPVPDDGQTRVYSPPSDISLGPDDEESGLDGPSPGGTYCPTCEREYEEGDRTFCPTCGTRLVG